MVIHVMGESHALAYEEFPKTWLHAATMHRIARDGIAANLRAELDAGAHVLVLVFGEIDVRCHVGAQIELGRVESEVIADLSTRFIRSVRAWQEETRCAVVVRGLVPVYAADVYDNAQFPVRGTVHDRARWRRLLDADLAESCRAHAASGLPLYFARTPAWLEDGEGFLRPDRSDGVIHVNQRFSPHLCADLRAFVEALPPNPLLARALPPHEEVRASVEGHAPFPFVIHAGVDAFISRDIREKGVWEPFESRVFEALLAHDDYVLDMGANIGWYAVLASNILGKDGQVDAFEPDARNFALLERNLALAGATDRVRAVNAAVDARCGEAAFYTSDTNMGDHRIFSDGTSAPTRHVRVTSLHAWLAGAPRLPNVLKSDTQGSEAKIFGGAEGLFDRGWRPVMVIEFWPFGLACSGSSAHEVFGQLLAWGYELLELTEGNDALIPFTRARMERRMENELAPLPDRYFVNLVCIPHGSPRRAKVERWIVPPVE